MTETAMLADVILPAANAYEKSGTFTNTCGDLQLLKKAGDIAMVKSDFEIIVRIAEKMDFDIHQLVPFGHGMRADFGQTRGAQSGEADRHAVWLHAHGLEPKVSPLDPIAVLDEIQRLVPGYDVSRLNLLAGNDQPTQLVNIQPAGIQGHPEWIVPLPRYAVYLRYAEPLFESPEFGDQGAPHLRSGQRGRCRLNYAAFAGFGRGSTINLVSILDVRV